MRKVLATIACFGMIAFAGGLSAQASGGSGSGSGTAQPELHGKDGANTGKSSHDRPVGNARLKLPATGNNTNPPEPSPNPPTNNPTPPSEGEDIPPSETPPDPPPPEDPPTYYGEPVQGKFAFVLDASGSMYGSRIATVRQETTQTISDMTEDDEFDCVAFGTQFGVNNDYSRFMWGALLPATDGNKSAATAWVNGPNLNPGGGTPTYACTKKACQIYPADLDKMFLLTDGGPNTSGSASQILADSPQWFQKFDDEFQLVCICIGGSGSAAQFMQQLASLHNGIYIAA